MINYQIYGEQLWLDNSEAFSGNPLRQMRIFQGYSAILIEQKTGYIVLETTLTLKYDWITKIQNIDYINNLNYGELLRYLKGNLDIHPYINGSRSLSVEFDAPLKKDGKEIIGFLVDIRAYDYDE